jgi:hypothetical protein
MKHINKRSKSKSRSRSKSRSKSRSIDRSSISKKDNISKKDRSKEVFKFFKNTYRLYIIAEATDSKLIKNYEYRQSKLGVTPIKSSPHITMMHIHVNADNPDHHHLIDKMGNINFMFKNIIEKKYHYISPNIYLKSRSDCYEIMGEFLAKVYTHDGEKEQITDFRMVMYLYLEMFLGKSTRQRRDIDGKVFYIYSYKGRELMAVPEYYHGIGVWTPHLSIIKLPILKYQNPKLYKEFKYDDYNVDVLIDEMYGVKGSINSLNMGMHFNRLLFSVNKL